MNFKFKYAPLGITNWESIIPDNGQLHKACMEVQFILQRYMSHVRRWNTLAHMLPETKNIEYNTVKHTAK